MNMNEEFEDMIRRHFTAGELAEFLDLEVTDIIDAFEDDVFQVHVERIMEEVGYEDETETD